MIGVAIAVLYAWCTGTTVYRVTNKQRQAMLTMFTHGVITTLQTDGLGALTEAVTVAVTETLRAAVVSHVSKEALALFRGYAHTVLTTHLGADWLAGAVPTFSLVSCLAVAFKRCVRIGTVLVLPAIMVPVHAFILWRTCEVLPLRRARDAPHGGISNGRRQRAMDGADLLARAHAIDRTKQPSRQADTRPIDTRHWTPSTPRLVEAVRTLGVGEALGGAVVRRPLGYRSALAHGAAEVQERWRHALV